MTTATLSIIENAPIPTWFKVGGRADRFFTPRTLDDLRSCDLEKCHALGDGANLLVDDDGVDLVLSLKSPAFVEVQIDALPRFEYGQITAGKRLVAAPQRAASR